MTRPEEVVSQLLEKMGYRVKPQAKQSLVDPENTFYFQYKVDRFTLDFALAPAKIAVEVDGEAWHRRTKEQIDHDRGRGIALQSMGWKLIKVSDTFVLKRPAVAMEHIQNSIMEALFI